MQAKLSNHKSNGARKEKRMKTKYFRADRLKEIMADNGVTVDELKTAVNSVAPFPRNLAFEIYNGFMEPSNAILVAISKLCNCSTDYLLGLSENPNPLG